MLLQSILSSIFITWNNTSNLNIYQIIWANNLGFFEVVTLNMEYKIL